ncbi:MAG TPA: M28 family peptidase [Acidimicrobiales bacterium]|nr:M28 family peptidase [Acidimicrobiales bacterium]
MTGRRVWAVALAGLALAGACSGDDGDDAGGSSSGSGMAPTTTAPAADEALERARATVEQLASDELEGRDDGTPGSTAARAYLSGLLEEFAEPLPGADNFEVPIPGGGTNLIGVIPGGDRADEVLVLGGHYDHLGRDCDSSEPDDDICNGAADNAAGVAVAIEAARALATAEEPPSRTVVIGLWDIEEDSLGGSIAYVTDPPFPLEDTIAYLNWDIQGANLAPSLTDLTVMVGAETGGPNLQAAAERAAGVSELRTLALSLLFGQGRSDHATFAEAEVPTVFFSDSNNSCYHTAQDEVETVDFDKLGQQILIGTALAEDLAATDELPEFDAGAPAASFGDAESMLEVVRSGQEDFDLFGNQEVAEAYLADLERIVEAGEGAFDDAAVSDLLGGAVDIVEALTTGECSGYLDQ